LQITQQLQEIIKHRFVFLINLKKDVCLKFFKANKYLWTAKLFTVWNIPNLCLKVKSLWTGQYNKFVRRYQLVGTQLSMWLTALFQMEVFGRSETENFNIFIVSSFLIRNVGNLPLGHFASVWIPPRLFYSNNLGMQQIGMFIQMLNIPM